MDTLHIFKFSFTDDEGVTLVYNNNNHDNVYGVVIMAELLREFTRFT